MKDSKTSQFTNENKAGGVALASGKPEFIFKSIRKVASSRLLIVIHLTTHSLFKTAATIWPKTHAECK